MRVFTLILVLSFFLTGCSSNFMSHLSSLQEASVLPTEVVLHETPQPVTQLEYFDPVYKEAAALGYDEEEVVNEMRNIIESCKDLIVNFHSINAVDGVYFDISEGERQTLLNYIGQMGYVAADASMDMCNQEQVHAFYSAYKSKNDAEIGIYTFDNGQISRITFLCRDGIIYCSVTTVEWDSTILPIIEFSAQMYELEIFTLTTKGYLFYGFNEVSTLHTRTVTGLRVDPLGEENRRIFRKYVDPLISYASTGVFSLDWDASDLRPLHLNDVFELLYKKDYGVAAETVFTDAFYGGKNDPKAVPAAEFEAVITKYFPVTAEELRTIAVYDPDKQTYAFEPMTLLQDASPVWEVVDFSQNQDGTLTIVMDGVSPENLLDRSVSNTVTIQPKNDGSFQYLSNRITRYDEKIRSAVPGFQEYFPRV